MLDMISKTHRNIKIECGPDKITNKNNFFNNKIKKKFLNFDAICFGVIYFKRGRKEYLEVNIRILKCTRGIFFNLLSGTFVSELVPFPSFDKVTNFYHDTQFEILWEVVNNDRSYYNTQRKCCRSYRLLFSLVVP